MTGLDAIIITVYLLCVGAVFLRAFSSLIQAKVSIQFERASLERQLQAQNLHNWVKINFKLADRYELDELQELELSVENTSSERTIYIDWDSSSAIDPDGRAQRIVRLTPGTTFDVLSSQVFSAIAPGKTLKEKFTVESALKRDPAIGTLKPVGGLVDLSKLKPDPKKKISPSQNTLLTARFSIRLGLRVGTGEARTSQNPFYILNCEFIAKQLPWTANLPWNQKKK